MANQFRVNQLLLSGQRVTANGTNLYLNGAAVGVNTDGITLSGNLTATGQTLVALNLSTSGALNDKIAANAAGVSTLNTLSGSLVIATAGSDLLSTAVSGQTIFVSGNLIASTTGLAATGQQAWAAADNNSRNLSGNLTLTGQTAQNNALNLSGNLFSTGANLSAVKVTGSSIIQVPNFSGMGGTLIIQSGSFVLISGASSAAVVVDHGDGINLSGQLTLTGQIDRNNALNLSGNLALTGQQSWKTL